MTLKDETLRNFMDPLQRSLRSGLYFSSALSAQLVLERFRNPAFKKYKQKYSLPAYFKEVARLHKQDRENIKNGSYLAPINQVPPLRQYLKSGLLTTLDLLKVKKRIQSKNKKVFGSIKLDNKFPDYYTQNFHDQSDGYLSESSANLYDHQVEMVFTGTAEAMRRHGIKALSEFYGKDFPNQSSFKILDIACGTGAFTHELKRHFPNSDVIGSDLSPWYLKKAEEISQINKQDINWVEANSEKLPFADEEFDIVSSVFQFHELPPLARENTLKEMFRVLKKGGVLVHIDSLQIDDRPVLNHSLEVFPHLYHEPFYSSYIREPIEIKLNNLGLKNLVRHLAFFSKVMAGQKAI